VAIAIAPAAGQTSEGTVITNTATVHWTDANGNTYTPASDAVSVTVGFQAGLSVAPDGGSQSPVPRGRLHRDRHQAWRDDHQRGFTDVGLTTAVSGDVLPGQSIWYKVTVSNASGTAAASYPRWPQAALPTSGSK